MTENEMVGWNHQINGHESEQTPRDGKGQGSLVCCSRWDHRVRHDRVTEHEHRYRIIKVLDRTVFIDLVGQQQASGGR